MIDYFTKESDPLLDPLIQSYYQANLNLARTIGFKFAKQAVAQNTYLVNEYGDAIVNQNDPTTWRYYLNLSGEYHPTDNIEIQAVNATLLQYQGLSTVPNVMQITSLDTTSTTSITFSKENLATNPNTAAAYAYGSKYYQTLVAQYPLQEELIMGILMPCNLTTAINACDGTVLRYDSSLVEFNEYSLIKNLETAIQIALKRWYVDAYYITDGPGFLIGILAQIGLLIITKIFNLRSGARNTYEAHSFHVRMFLRGYMGLDAQYTMLTQQQAMWLYRNLPRLVKFMGYDSQFTELLTNILTPRNIQMLGYNIQQTQQIVVPPSEAAMIAAVGTSGFDAAWASYINDLSDPTLVGSNYAPGVAVVPTAVNTLSIPPSLLPFQPTELFALEATVLYGTQDYYDANSQDILFTLQHQNESSVVTKDLSTTLEPQATIFSRSLQDFLFAHWAIMAYNGMYTGNIVFENPRTGDNVTLSPKDAFVYLYYLSLSYTSQDMVANLLAGLPSTETSQLVELSTLQIKKPVTIVPEFLVESHVNYQPMTYSDLLIVVENEQSATYTPIAQQLIQQFVPLTPVSTPQAFYTLVTQLFQAYNNQMGYAISFADPVQRAYVKNMVYQMYRDTLVQFYPLNTPISSVLMNSNNNLDSYETLQTALPGTGVAIIVTNILQAATGVVLGTNNDPQAVSEAMFNILASLTSYDVQYISQDNETPMTSARYSATAVSGSSDSTPMVSTIPLSATTDFLDYTTS